MMCFPAADLIATDLEQELTLLDPDDGEVLALSASGRRIWFALPARTPDELANVLTSSLDVAPAQALKDIHSLIAALQGPGLVWYENDLS
jgi:Coenzyme PQQ synthesis protein D (PqqD)